MYFSSSIISDLLDFARLNHVNIDHILPQFEKFQKDEYISYEIMVESINLLFEHMGDENLGLHIGEQISLKVKAYVDGIMQYSTTLEEAFENAVEYSRLISDALTCTLHKSEDYYSVTFEENPDWKVHQSHAKRQILDLTLLSCLQSLVTYTNSNYYPIKILFEYPKPKYLNEYYRLFNCSLYFNQNRTEIFFEKRIFDTHSKMVEKGLLESLKTKVQNEMDHLKEDDKLLYKLKKCILQNKPKRILIEEAASELHMSKRTLQRNLKELDTTFKAVEHELQLRLAKTYLEESQKSIDEISYLLGFSESSAFIRFFKTLTDQTPKAYINTLQY